MSDRAGPPTPRNPPMKIEAPAPADAAVERVQYAARDNAWRAYHDAECANWTPRDTVVAKYGFMAGWAARKEAEWAAVIPVNQNKSVDRRTLPVATLFPTENEVNGQA